MKSKSPTADIAIDRHEFPMAEIAIDEPFPYAEGASCSLDGDCEACQ